MQGYPVPSKRVRVEIRVSNSRFIATLDRADCVDAAKAILRAIREEMPDATHHVHAFRVGWGGSVTEGMSDDGEPAGTSGPPTLAVLRGAGVGDAVVVITRYYGGTKLGTGGLVAAYGDATKAAIAAMETERKIDRRVVSLAAPYAMLDRLRILIAEREGIVESEEYGAEVELRVALPVDALDAFAEDLRGFSAGKLAFREGREGEEGEDNG